MSELKYKVGDKIRIKSIGWYNENKNYNHGDIHFENFISFVEGMSEYCGQVATITKVIENAKYKIDLDKGYYYWTDEMIEGLANDATGLNIY